MAGFNNHNDVLWLVQRKLTMFVYIQDNNIKLTVFEIGMKQLS